MPPKTGDRGRGGGGGGGRGQGSGRGQATGATAQAGAGADETGSNAGGGSGKAGRKGPGNLPNLSKLTTEGTTASQSTAPVSAAPVTAAPTATVSSPKTGGVLGGLGSFFTPKASQAPAGLSATAKTGGTAGYSLDDDAGWGSSTATAGAATPGRHAAAPRSPPSNKPLSPVGGPPLVPIPAPRVTPAPISNTSTKKPTPASKPVTMAPPPPPEPMLDLMPEEELPPEDDEDDIPLTNPYGARQRDPLGPSRPSMSRAWRPVQRVQAPSPAGYVPPKEPKPPKPIGERSELQRFIHDRDGRKPIARRENTRIKFSDLLK